jgi:hypothetical protein
MYKIELTIIGKKAEFDSFLSNEFVTNEEFSHIHRDEIVSWGVEGIVCKMVRDFTPDAYGIEKMTKRYPSLCIKMTWISPDGSAGVYMARHKSIRVHEWQDFSEEEELSFRSH